MELFEWLHWRHSHNEARRVSDRSSGILLREGETEIGQVAAKNLDKKIIQFLSVELTCANLGSEQILTLFIKRRESQGHTQLSMVGVSPTIFAGA